MLWLFPLSRLAVLMLVVGSPLLTTAHFMHRWAFLCSPHLNRQNWIFPVPSSGSPVLKHSPSARGDMLSHLTFAGQEAQPDSEPDHAPCVVLCLWEGGVPGAAPGRSPALTPRQVPRAGGSVAHGAECLARFCVPGVNVAMGRSSLKVAACSQRTTSPDLQDLPAKRQMA